MDAITARDFRQNMKSVLDRVTAGEEIVINRGTEYFIITPVTMRPVITPDLQARIDAAREEIRKGQSVTFEGPEDIRKWAEAL